MTTYLSWARLFIFQAMVTIGAAFVLHSRLCLIAGLVAMTFGFYAYWKWKH